MAGALDKFISTLSRKGLEFIGLYYGKYRAIVVDNDDPEGMNRIKVIVPRITGNTTNPHWAISSQYTGKGYGSQCLPQKGDIVFIECADGKSDVLIWSHANYHKGDKPEEFSDTKIFGFKSPEGTYVLIDDTNKQVVIQTKNGEYIKVEVDKLIAEAKAIEIGTQNLEPAVKGDKNADIHNEHLQHFINLINAMNAWISTDGPVLTGLGLTGISTLAATINPIGGQAATTKGKVSTTKSDKIKVE